jgi:hypothetical protein
MRACMSCVVQPQLQILCCWGAGCGRQWRLYGASAPCSSISAVRHTLLLSLHVCRVTPDGGTAVTGSTPTAAWQELYKNAPAVEGLSAKASAAAVAARAASVCGPRLFGLQHPTIQAIIESLPDAAYCDRFLAWKGTPPAPPPLVSHTKRCHCHCQMTQRRACMCKVFE